MERQQTAPPFSCTFTPALAELLWQLDCSIAVSTYQAGKVVLLSPKSKGEGLYQYPRTFAKPMGIAVDGHRLAIATRDQVKILANTPGLATAYHKRPNTYDSLYIPRASFNTGALDVHDLQFQNGSLIAINTLFSCLCKIESGYSFIPIWQPPFISKLIPNDHCHLNGLAMVDGKARYVTALGTTDSQEGWRELQRTGGVLLDVTTNEIVLQGLAMPHSPRVYNDKLYLLLSASGELVSADLNSGKCTTVTKLPGFARGLAKCGDYVFVGISRLRSNHKFGDLPIAKMQPFCGVVVVHFPTGAIVGTMQYVNSCEEIYDVQVITGLGRPAILREDDPFCTASLSLPEQVFWSNPQTKTEVQPT